MEGPSPATQKSQPVLCVSGEWVLPHYHTATWGVTWLRPGDQPGALSGGELFHRGPWGPAEENLAKNHQPKDQHTGDASASEPRRV